MKRLMAAASGGALLLTLAACGGGAGGAHEDPPRSATNETPVASSWTTCENSIRGFTVRSPAGWHTSSLHPADACRWFHPEPFELVDGTDCCPRALEVQVSDQLVERALASYSDPLYYRVLSREELAGAPRTVRIEVLTTAKGLYDEGTRIYAYLIERGQGTVAVQTTAHRTEDRYAQWTRVVDEAARTLAVAPPAANDGEVVLVFFANERLQRDGDPCGEVFPRERAMSEGVRAEERLAAALGRLLEGPTAAEREEGYSSWFSRETAGMLRAVRLLDSRVARIDFDDFSAILDGANTSCGSAYLLAALNQTVRAAADGRDPVYSFRGDCAAFYEWLQGSAPACAPVFDEWNRPRAELGRP